MIENPFSLSFGMKPVSYINRFAQSQAVINEFSKVEPTNKIFMITGVRGAGKTVFMSNIAQHFKQEKEWIVIDLNPELDLLTSFCSKLYENQKLHSLFINAKIDISVFGLNLSLSSNQYPINSETLLEKLLTVVKKNNKKVLITIDEVTNSKTIREFAHSFQMFIRNDYPVFLLMTGLYDNLNVLQNEKTLTFLYRTPKINLEPLSLIAIKEAYKSIFQIEEKEASIMANYTKGYSFAYQVLGYLVFNSREKTVNDSILSQYDQYLEEYVYDKLYSELSVKDITFVKAIANSKTNDVASILELSSMKKNEFSVYRDRLKKKGILDCSIRGQIQFILPRFKEYVLIKNALDF